MPSNFHSAIQFCGGPSAAASPRRPLPGMREIERIGLARVERSRLGVRDLCDQRGEILRRRRAPRMRVADHALRHVLLIDACNFGQRLHDLQPRHADPKLAGDELEESETLIGRQMRRRSARAAHNSPLRRAGAASAGDRASMRRAAVFARVARRQQQREGLGEVADVLIAFLEEPSGQPGPRARVATAAASARSGAACRRRGNRSPRPRSPQRAGSSLAAGKASTSAACFALVDVGLIERR